MTIIELPSISPLAFYDWEGEAKRIAIQAAGIENAKILMAGENGKIVGVAAFRDEGETIKLVSLASRLKGVGTALVEVLKYKTKPIWLGSLVGAEGFYEKVGFRRDGMHNKFVRFVYP